MTTGAISFQTSASTNQKQKSCYGKVEYWPEADEHEWVIGLGPKAQRRDWAEELEAASSTWPLARPSSVLSQNPPKKSVISC